MKKIPLKNYFILGGILAVSAFIVISFNMIYINAKKSQNTMDDFIKEIKPVEIDNYIVENPNFIIYFGTLDEGQENFKKNFKKFLIKEDLKNDVIFVDLNLFDDEKFNKFVSKYSDGKFSIGRFDNIVIVDNQKIVNVLLSKQDKLEVKKIKSFFKENGVL